MIYFVLVDEAFENKVTDNENIKMSCIRLIPTCTGKIRGEGGSYKTESNLGGTI